MRAARARRQRAREELRRGRRDFVLGAVFCVLAVAVLVAAPHVLDRPFALVRGSSSELSQAGTATMWGLAIAFLVLGVLAVRRVSGGFGHLVVARSGAPGAAAPVRLITAIVGYVVVFFGTLGILRVDLTHLLIGAGLAGVVLGIAGQQSLGNVFAGIVLVTAKPFTVGDAVRIRSGALGGIFEGVVTGMSLTYVTLNIEGTSMKIPNSGMLAAAVGRLPRRPGHTGPVPAVGVPSGAVPVVAPGSAAAPAVAGATATPVGDGAPTETGAPGAAPRAADGAAAELLRGGRSGSS